VDINSGEHGPPAFRIECRRNTVLGGIFLSLQVTINPLKMPLGCANRNWNTSGRERPNVNPNLDHIAAATSGEHKPQPSVIKQPDGDFISGPRSTWNFWNLLSFEKEESARLIVGIDLERAKLNLDAAFEAPLTWVTSAIQFETCSIVYSCSGGIPIPRMAKKQSTRVSWLT